MTLQACVRSVPFLMIEIAPVSRLMDSSDLPQSALKIFLLAKVIVASLGTVPVTFPILPKPTFSKVTRSKGAPGLEHS